MKNRLGVYRNSTKKEKTLAFLPLLLRLAVSFFRATLNSNRYLSGRVQQVERLERYTGCWKRVSALPILNFVIVRIFFFFF